MTEELVEIIAPIFLPKDIAKILYDIGNEKDMTVAEVIKSAVEIYKYLKDKDESGAKILIENKDGTIKQIVFLPKQ